MPLAPAGESSQVVMLMRVRGEARVGEGAGQAGDVQLQPGFKRFSEQVSRGGGGLIAWQLTPPAQGSLSPLGFPERGAQGRVNWRM